MYLVVALGALREFSLSRFGGLRQTSEYLKMKIYACGGLSALKINIPRLEVS